MVTGAGGLTSPLPPGACSPAQIRARTAERAELVADVFQGDHGGGAGARTRATMSAAAVTSVMGAIFCPHGHQ